MVVVEVDFCDEKEEDLDIDGRLCESRLVCDEESRAFRDIIASVGRGVLVLRVGNEGTELR